MTSAVNAAELHAAGKMVTVVNFLLRGHPVILNREAGRPGVLPGPRWPQKALRPALSPRPVAPLSEGLPPRPSQPCFKVTWHLAW